MGELVGTSVMPLHQRNDSAIIRSTPAVNAAELLMYKGAVSSYDGQRLQRISWWQDGKDCYSALFLQAKALKLPTMKRVVSQASGDEAQGQCFGLTVGGSGA